MTGRFDIGQACLNGHAINSAADRMPEFNTPFCSDCGEPTTTQCSNCSQPIRGSFYSPGLLSFGEWDPPKFCHACGKPYPWTERATEVLRDAISELDGLTEGEADKLVDSIPDVLRETPKTDLAIGRFKKAIAKGGKISGKILYDTIIKFGTEIAVSAMKG